MLMIVANKEPCSMLTRSKNMKIILWIYYYYNTVVIINPRHNTHYFQPHSHSKTCRNGIIPQVTTGKYRCYVKLTELLLLIL